MRYALFAIALLAPAQNALPPASCPVTKPASTFVSPIPAITPARGYFFVGTDKLWTQVPESGAESWYKWKDGYIHMKLPWFSVNYPKADLDAKGRLMSPKPMMTISVLRLDGEATPPPNQVGYFSWTQSGAFFMSGPKLSTEGCWEITGGLDDIKLSFVVWVRGVDAP